MPPVQNGVRASSLDARWIKSRHSNAEGNCVEVAALTGGGIAVRNSRDPDGPALVYTRRRWPRSWPARRTASSTICCDAGPAPVKRKEAADFPADALRSRTVR